jgi:hypothetical protein
VNGSKCDCLGPPIPVRASSKERIDERVSEFARPNQITTKFSDRSSMRRLACLLSLGIRRSLLPQPFNVSTGSTLPRASRANVKCLDLTLAHSLAHYFQHLGILADSERLNLSPMHWIRQSRHQGEPLFLAFQMMVQDVSRHRHPSVVDHDCATSNPLTKSIAHCSRNSADEDIGSYNDSGFSLFSF